MKTKVWVLSINALDEKDSELDLQKLSDEEFIALCNKYPYDSREYGIKGFEWDFNNEDISCYNQWIRFV